MYENHSGMAEFIKTGIILSAFPPAASTAIIRLSEEIHIRQGSDNIGAPGHYEYEEGPYQYTLLSSLLDFTVMNLTMSCGCARTPTPTPRIIVDRRVHQYGLP